MKLTSPLRYITLLALTLFSGIAFAQQYLINTVTPFDVAAGTAGVKLNVTGDFVAAPQYFCFYAGGSSGNTTPIAVSSSDTASAVVSVPAATIQSLTADDYNGGGGYVYAALYVVADPASTCDGSFESGFTNEGVVYLSYPNLFELSLSSIRARNPNLTTTPAPFAISLWQGDGYSAFNTFTISSAANQTNIPLTAYGPQDATAILPAQFPAPADPSDTTLNFALCDLDGASPPYCATPLQLPIVPLTVEDGTLTANPNPTTTATATSLTATFTPEDTVSGVPSGQVTFSEGGTTLGTAPLQLTTGQFSPGRQNGVEFPGGSVTITQVITADFNHDGLADQFFISDGGANIVFAQNTEGVFHSAVSLPAPCGGGVKSAAVGDFNSDGFPDIAIVCQGDPTPIIAIYLNIGDGTFNSTPQRFSVDVSAQLATADFNHDGKLDLVSTDPSGLNIYLGDGTGNFAAPTFISAPIDTPTQIVAADLNNDGAPDILLLGGGPTNNPYFFVYQNNGSGGFPSSPTYTRILGDGTNGFRFFLRPNLTTKLPDIVALDNGPNSQFELLINSSTAAAITFQDTGFNTQIPNLDSAVVSDVTGDGWADITIYDGTNVYLYPSDSTGFYTLPLASFTTPASQITLTGASDLNQDGYSDPIALGTSGSPYFVQQFLVTGSAAATLPNLSFASGPHNLTATTIGTATLSAGSASTTLNSTGASVMPIITVVMNTTNPTTYTGSNVSFGGDVRSTSGPAPTGTIQFFDNGNLLGTQNLGSLGVAESLASLLTTFTAGTHPLTVTYSGDGNYLGGTSAILNYVVSQADPSFTFAPNPAEITYPTPLSSAQLNGGANTPGTFAYTFNGNPVSTGTILPVGVDQIVANFTPGDTTDYAKPLAIIRNITVDKDSSSTVLTVSPNSPTTFTPGGQETLTATVTTPQSPAPTGSVQFFDAITSTNFGSITLTPITATTSTASITVGPLAMGTHQLSASYGGDATYVGSNSSTVNYTVQRSTPTLAWSPSPFSITFGTALAPSQFNATAMIGGSTVAGVFTYTFNGNQVDTTTVLPAGNDILTVSFAPTDTTNYAKPSPITTTIQVLQATPTITWGNPADIVYGTPLSGTQLNATASFNGNPVNGNFAYSQGTGSILSVGTQGLSVTFTPSDATDYKSNNAAVTIIVTKATPTLTWATPTDIPYGTALSGTQLDATATLNSKSVNGSFSYDPAPGTVLNVGTSPLKVTFTPSDGADINGASISTSITVTKSSPTLTWSTPANIVYGTALSATQLNATATFNGNPVSGTFSYTPGAGTVLNVGTNSLKVTFTPDNVADLNPIDISTSITVTKSTPTIIWVPPASITAGTALSGTQLDASATGIGNTPLLGTFNYTPAAGAILPPGPTNLSVTFTPNDAADYNTATFGVPLTVNPAITATTVTSATNPSQFGQPVVFNVGVTSAYTGVPLTGPVSVYDGSILIGTSPTPNGSVSTSTLSAGSHSITAVFTGNTNFAGGTSSQLSQAVTAVTTTVAWPTPANIVYGTKLSATQLNATVSTPYAASVPGTFTYSSPVGTLLPAGTRAITVMFAPADAVSYKPATGTVNITVTKATPTINWTAPASITAGTPLSTTQLNATALDISGLTLPGAFTYTPAAGTILAPGATTLNATFVPTDTTDYINGSATVPLTVNPAVSTIAVTNSANPSEYGQPVTLTINVTSVYTGAAITGSVTLLDGATVLGTPALANGSATVNTSALTAGAHNITASYVGNANFAGGTSPALVQTVNQGAPTVNWPQPAGITYGTVISATQQTASVSTTYFSTVPGTFAYKQATGTVLNAGAQTLSVVFTPSDAANFKTANGSVTLNVGQANPTITWPTPEEIVVGTPLSSTQLNATAAGVSGALAGAFVYRPAAGTILTSGAQTLSTTFTPTDTVNYATATASVPLNVISVGLITVTPNTASLGDAAKTITVVGAGFVTDSIVQIDGTPIATTYVNKTTLTAVIPSASFTTVHTMQVTVFDPSQNQTTNALTIPVTQPAVTVVLQGPSTVTTGAQPNLTFTLPQAYPFPITGTFTLNFTPAPGLPNDPTIVFPNGKTTLDFTIPANSTATPAVIFQSGSVAGTITVTLTLSAGGQTLIPTPVIAPLVIAAPTTVPGINGVTVTRSGSTLTVAILGFSNIREIDHINFHFIPAPGKTLSTSDLTIDGATLFGPYYTSAASQQVGSTFEYDQVFNLNDDASVVGQVQVTLVNTLGSSQTVTAQ